MTDMTTPKLTTTQHWPATILACVLIAALAVIYAVSSPDQRSQLLLGAGALGVTVQGFMPAFRKLAGVTVIALVFFGAAISGCGQTTPVAQQATAVDVAAIVVATAASIVHQAADADAESTCPDGSDPSCTDAVSARWAPVDAAITAARTTLGAWLAADRIAAAANEDPITEAADEIGAFVSAYDALRAALAFAHADLPRLPAQVCAVAGVPSDECEPTAGGVS